MESRKKVYDLENDRSFQDPEMLCLRLTEAIVSFYVTLRVVFETHTLCTHICCICTHDMKKNIGAIKTCLLHTLIESPSIHDFAHLPIERLLPRSKHQ
jgi:hypothetical protein